MFSERIFHRALNCFHDSPVPRTARATLTGNDPSFCFSPNTKGSHLCQIICNEGRRRNYVKQSQHPSVKQGTRVSVTSITYQFQLAVPILINCQLLFQQTNSFIVNMRPARLSALALLLMTCLSNAPFVRSANVCLLLYLMADNDLEFPIRGDLEEFVSSPLIKSQSLTSWVYFDHRNFFFSLSENIYDRLPFVYNKDGSERSGDKPEGSFYFRYDHGLGKLIIEEDLGELNSDSPQTVEDFVDRGLADCISRGSEEFMIVFGSHGGGFLGFGGDENMRRNNRALVQENNLIVGALRSALDKNLGPGSKFDIVGFDACLMQALGAADDYKSVAKYLLASEEVEPGHGK